ncbi:hypothetical protein HR12_40440 [Microbacterium sp. SUBG005]|nr:hypothetical protein HR12_40440 [Microbacterium sp. SUBG005]
MVVSNGPLTAGGRERLEALGDMVLERPNEGYDIWGYKHGLDAMQDRLEEFDELLLVNDTWFGPIRPFAPLFERMNGHPLHFWGMTDHLRVEPTPSPRRDTCPTTCSRTGSPCAGRCSSRPSGWRTGATCRR